MSADISSGCQREGDGKHQGLLRTGAPPTPVNPAPSSGVRRTETEHAVLSSAGHNNNKDSLTASATALWASGGDIQLPQTPARASSRPFIRPDGQRTPGEEIQPNVPWQTQTSQHKYSPWTTHWPDWKDSLHTGDQLT